MKPSLLAPIPTSYFVTLDSWTLVLVSNPCWWMGCLLYHQFDSAQHSCLRYCRVGFSARQNLQKSVEMLPTRTPLAHTRMITHSCFSSALASSFLQGALNVSIIHVSFLRNARVLPTLCFCAFFHFCSNRVVDNNFSLGASEGLRLCCLAYGGQNRG